MICLVLHKCVWVRGWCLWCGAPRPLSEGELLELRGLEEDDFVGSEGRFWGLLERKNREK